MTRVRPNPTRRSIRAGPPPRRQLSHRNVNPRILIVGEGKETERNYFYDLCGEDVVRQRFTVTVKRGAGGSALAVVQQAVEELERAARRGEEYDEAWCVFDCEGEMRRSDVQSARQLAVRRHI